MVRTTRFKSLEEHGNHFLERSYIECLPFLLSSALNSV